MSRVIQKFELFFDVDGNPLESGYIYIGVVSLNPETNPVTVYSDSALTVPIAQPVRTSSGYPVNNGNKIELFVAAEDYSITVKDKNESQVYTSLDSDNPDAIVHNSTTGRDVAGAHTIGSITGLTTALDAKIDTDVNSLTGKPTPIDADELIIADSATAFSLKKLTWANVKATLKAYFDQFYDNKVLQKVNFSTGTYASGTTQIPLDDTIPQNTEGTQFMTLGITPISATSKLRITVTAVWSNSSAGQMTLALFRDAVVDSIGAVSEDSSSDTMHTVTFSVTVDSNSTDLTDFKFRMGLNGGSTNYFNGRSGTRTLGGVSASSITIEEIE